MMLRPPQFSVPAFPAAGRWRAALLGLAPLALALAACTSGPAASPSGPASGGVVSSGPLSPPSGDPNGPNPVTTEPAKDAVKQAFVRAEGVPGSPVVRVEGLLTPGPPCAVIGRADVVETSTRVTITIWVGARPDADCSGPQKMVQYPYILDVPLKEPLGGRVVVDGAA